MNVNGGVPVNRTLKEAGSSPDCQQLHCQEEKELTFSEMDQTLLNPDRGEGVNDAQ